MEKKYDSKTLRLYYKLLLGISALILISTVAHDWMAAKPLPKIIPLSAVFFALGANMLKEASKKREEQESAGHDDAAKKKK